MEYKDINSLEDVKTYIQQGNSLNLSQIFALTRKLGRSESVIRDAMKGTLPQDTDPALAKAATTGRRGENDPASTRSLAIRPKSHDCVSKRVNHLGPQP